MFSIKTKQFYFLPFVLLGIILLCLNSFAEPNSDSKKIVKSQDIPEFELKIVGSSEPMNKQKLLEKVYLLDFWMTTCHGCQDKMPFLHNIYEKYKEKNFVIISISFDKSLDDLEAFRKDKWKMPWLHSLAVENGSDEIRMLFEVYSLPKLVLVDQYGKIVCTNADTDDLGIEQVLEKILK